MPEPELLQQAKFVADPDMLYQTLVSEVAWEEHIKARKTASFGQAYNYSRITYAVTPMHPLLVPIVNRLEAALGFRPNNCLLNFYEDGGSSMGYHSDSTEELAPGTGVAIVSLGAERSITFRSIADGEEKYSYPLQSGSLLYMSQQIQHEWKHAIPKQAEAGGRISLTFRQLNPAAA
jgi:alkylated DNA repair dioxygenase AlkB